MDMVQNTSKYTHASYTVLIIVNDNEFISDCHDDRLIADTFSESVD